MGELAVSRGAKLVGVPHVGWETNGSIDMFRLHLAIGNGVRHCCLFVSSSLYFAFGG